MRAIGYVLIAGPVVLICLVGLIFDTADFLVAMAVFACIVIPIAAGMKLLEKANDQ